MKPYAVFVGLPGAGKSTVARELGSTLHIMSRDADDLIAERAGRSIPEIFEADGEEGFRALEADVVIEALDTFPGILSLGGGAVTTPAIRKALRGHRVVHMTADRETLLERLTRHEGKRPLIDVDPAARLDQLSAERTHLYAQVATHTFTSTTDPVDNLVNHIAGILEGERPTRVDVGDYDVRVDRGLARAVAQSASGSSAAFLVHPAHLTGVATRLADDIRAGGVEAHLFEVPAGEAQKTIEVASAAWDRLGELKLGRDSIVYGIGGGATTDLAGFIAATWLRGVDLVQVPTSLLAMVDAAVGGKTGIDIAAGKNLVGSFYKPDAVFADLDMLRTLPAAEMRAGLGEVVKCGWIADPVILDLVEHPDISDPASDITAEAITRSIQVKADIVTDDFRESGRREFLNYGHTLAHAIEKVENYSIRHGDAVAIGSVFAAALAEKLGVAEPGLTERHRTTYGSLGLPIRYKPGRADELMNAMYSDKKVRAGKLRFVLLADQGKPVIYQPTDDEVRSCLAAVGA